MTNLWLKPLPEFSDYLLGLNVTHGHLPDVNINLLPQSSFLQRLHPTRYLSVRGHVTVMRPWGDYLSCCPAGIHQELSKRAEP